MKKIIIIGGMLCALASFPANAQMVFEFPQGNSWRDISSDRYWRQVRINQEAEERAREEARDRERHEEFDRHDNGNHHSNRHGKGHHRGRSDHRDDDDNDHNRNNR